MPSAAALALGAGKLYIAPIGTTEPTDLTTALAAAWVDLGYTEDGSEFGYSLSTENVEVAEELDPVRVVTTGREITLAFELAEITASNLKRALNGGTISAVSGTAPNQFVTFEPPAIGTEVRTMLLWQSEDLQERWIFRQCFQTGSVSVARRKAPNKATIPAEFTLEKPATGLQPFRAIMASTVRA